MSLVSASVSVLLRRRPVIAEAVRFNDEAKLWPEEVDPPARAIQSPAQFIHVQAIERVRFIDGRLELTRAEVDGDVNEREQGRRHRNAVVLIDPLAQPAAAMNDDACTFTEPPRQRIETWIGPSRGSRIPSRAAAS